MRLTTDHQDCVLITLRDGGNLIYVYNEEDAIWMLTDKDGNTEVVRRDTIRKLVDLRFLYEGVDFPAIGVVSGIISKLGKDWLKANGI